ncbi:uncharacterized protein LOC125210495 [Salvia hispanica]|uniref:uncharacterized protein LOC125210495 n=1 Tax=Salvia hispanica TaxID=49212 RepID=UPI00200937D6|nr:uncharacterized protein LOC125210495 [Salvia hispanica]
MRRELFLQIVHALETRDEYFQWREDAAHRKGPSPLTKCTVVLRQLAYGTTADMFDEYLHVGDTTGRECLDLLWMHDTVHGFPEMLGSIDCMHWEWKNCPAAWRGQFTNGYKGTHPTMILEAIVDYSLWIWHAHFGVAGSNNDINVLNSSSLFTEQCNGNGPIISFTANGRQHHMGYYLADGIYPRWPVFLKTISCPTGARREFFAAKQEAARKDVEHHIANVMYVCIILHNMIIHDEGRAASQWSDDEAAPSAGHAAPPVVRGLPYGLSERLQAQKSMRNQQAHLDLMNDMIEEVFIYGATVSWKSSLQNIVVLSTTKAEYMALTAATRKSFWLQGVSADFGVKQEVVALGCDNNGAIYLAENQALSKEKLELCLKLVGMCKRDM